MKRIEWWDPPVPWDRFLQELRDCYGEPQPWPHLWEEPQRLEPPHKWALGQRRGGGSGMPRPCVWIDTDVYTWYVLKWP